MATETNNRYSDLPKVNINRKRLLKLPHLIDNDESSSSSEEESS